MKKYSAILMVVCLFARMSVGDVFQDLAKYKYGEGNTADEADQLMQKTPVAEHGAIEASLIAVVSAKDATQDGKSFACRMLQQIGTEKCIPAVAGLLGDEVLSHNARLVLERMGNPKADEAMRAALDKAPDKAKIGIMGSLGVRRYEKAAKQVAALVGNSDPAVASAAISALGKIGGKTAAKCLRKLAPAETLKQVHMIALLDCARSLEGSSAVSLYEIVLAGKTTHRIAALGGMLAADEKKAVALMVDFVKGDDAQMYGGVLTLVCGEKSDRLTKAMVELLATLPDQKKIALITALGARGDKAAAGSIAGCMASSNEAIRNAAVMAASKIGDDGMVKTLLGINNGSREAIAKMSGASVNDALIKALEDSKLKAPAIRALVARNCTAALPMLFNLLNDGDLEVRRSAWDGLGSLAIDDDVAKMAKSAFAIKDEGELSCAVAATRNVCAHAGDKTKSFEIIASYYDTATDASKSAIVDLASLVGNPVAMDVVKKAMKSGNKDMYGKGLRSLAAWCNETAAGDLLELAKSAPEEVDRIIALRGYIRIAGADGVNLNEEQRAEMLKKSAELATRVDEKKMILGGMHKAHNVVTLGLVNKYMDDPALREEAEHFAVSVVEHLRKDGPADQVKELANKLLTSKNQGYVDRAKGTIENIGK